MQPHKRDMPWDSPAEPAAPFGATMASKHRVFLPFKWDKSFLPCGCACCFSWKGLKNRIEIVIFPSEEAEAELHSPLPQDKPDMLLMPQEHTSPGPCMCCSSSRDPDPPHHQTAIPPPVTSFTGNFTPTACASKREVINGVWSCYQGCERKKKAAEKMHCWCLNIISGAASGDSVRAVICFDSPG